MVINMSVKSLVSVLISKASYIIYQRMNSSIFISNAQHVHSIKYYNNITHRKTIGSASQIAIVNNASKAKLVKGLNFQSEEDALPFYTLPLKTLVYINKTTKNDKESGFCENRLYYIAHRIKCPPFVLSQRIIRRTFIYNLSFHWLESSLDVLLDMGVPGDRILRDLWVLKYHHETIHERLQRVKSLGINNLYPWMVRCSEDILNRYIEIFQETKTILGDNSTTMYLAKRLNISPEIIEEMYLKLPALKSTRAAKVKSFLDFLLEQGFSLEEITNKVRILTASQNTVKQRLEKLRKLGLRDINLNVLCRSRKDFQKYCESVKSSQE